MSSTTGVPLLCSSKQIRLAEKLCVLSLITSALVIPFFLGVLLTQQEVPADLPFHKISTERTKKSIRKEKRQGTLKKPGSNLEDNHKPTELFMDRLNRLLPLNGSHRFVTADIGKMEQTILQFDIPRPIVIHVPTKSVSYLSIQMYRWLFHDQQQSSTSEMCPNCYLRFDPEADKYNDTDRSNVWYRNAHLDGTNAYVPDVILHLGCPTEGVAKEAPWQVTVGGCGESQKGNGEAYATKGRQFFDYHAGFEVVGNGTFQTTYAHLHLVPGDPSYHDTDTYSGQSTNNSKEALSTFGFEKSFWMVKDTVRQLLEPYPNQAIRNHHSLEPEPAMFVHNNCAGNPRGSFVTLLLEMDAKEIKKQRHKNNASMAVASYACHRNKRKPQATRLFEGARCGKLQTLFHDDCEATRDAGKTILSSYHKFTFTLENTLSQDYFTEKRWQALLAGSVPIVWNNHNSLDSLPDVDAALTVTPPVASPSKSQHTNMQNKEELQKYFHEAAQKLLDQLRYYDKNETAYQDFFRWKERGLSAAFVRKLFLSTDHLVCRICEHVAHHRIRDDRG